MRWLRYSFLLRELVKRDVQGRYAGSLFGFLWSFVHPLFQLALYTFVFATVLKISPVGERTSNFAVFLFCGLLPWLAIQEGVSRAAAAITDQATLVKKLAFPGEVLVLAVVFAALLHEAIAAGLFLVVLVAIGQFTVRGLPLLAVALPLQLALTLGLGLLLAATNVFFRDTTQLLNMGFAAWFYLTPIVYPLALVPPRFLPWIAWNPLTTLVELYRDALLGAPLALPAGTGALALVALVLLLLGLGLFRHLAPGFADEI